MRRYFSSMIAALLAAFFFGHLFALPNKPAVPTSRVTVVGAVYCDTCFTNTFSKHSYFLPGADVQIQCTIKASEPETREQISFSVNRTTNRYGTFELDVPEVDGVDCVDGSALESQCQATLLRSNYAGCNSPSLKTTTSVITVKSKQESLCIYSMSALSFRPSKKNASLCGNYKEELLDSEYQSLHRKEESLFVQRSSFNSSKFFLPFPPYIFPWPSLPLPPLPPLPQLPPFPSIPLPPLAPFFQFPPFPGPPSLPFPLPPIPPLFHAPPLPDPPAFNPLDPRTWFPHFPLPPPAAPGFNLGDPTTWVPHFPPSTLDDQKTP